MKVEFKYQGTWEEGQLCQQILKTETDYLQRYLLMHFLNTNTQGKGTPFAISSVKCSFDVLMICLASPSPSSGNLQSVVSSLHHLSTTISPKIIYQSFLKFSCSPLTAMQLFINSENYNFEQPSLEDCLLSTNTFHVLILIHSIIAAISFSSYTASCKPL